MLEKFSSSTSCDLNSRHRIKNIMSYLKEGKFFLEVTMLSHSLGNPLLKFSTLNSLILNTDKNPRYKVLGGLIEGALKDWWLKE